MDFREYTVIREGDEAVVVGTIRDPVNWDFSIRVCEDDVIGMTKLILRKEMLLLLLRSIFKPRKQHHWSDDHAEHLAEGKQRLVVAKEKAHERIRANAEGAKQVSSGKKSAPRSALARGTGGGEQGA